MPGAETTGVLQLVVVVALLLLSPWWFPTVVDVLIDIANVSRTGESRGGWLADSIERKGRGRARPRRFDEEGITWTRRPISNARWSTGRRPGAPPLAWHRSSRRGR